MPLADRKKPAVAQFLRKPLNVCIATIGDSGVPHLTGEWFTWSDDRFLVSATDDRAKYRNVKRDRHVALSIIDPANPYRYISIGTVEVSRERTCALIVEEAVR